VIFGATGDLAKLETFPALVGLVDRGVLDVPVIGVAKNGWGLEQFRDYAVASLKLNNMDPGSPAATKMLGLLRYVDGDLGDDATYHAMSDTVGDGRNILSPRPAGPRATGSWWRSRSAPTWTARSSWTR
jgi:glucose-6-phosphate 1-dehydrogenase